MVKIIEVDASRIDEIFELVQAFDNPISKEGWLRALSAPWTPEGRPTGYAAIDGDEMIGFLGAMFVERTVDGVTEQHCNLHTLILDESRRGVGAKLMVRGIRTKAPVLTALTPVRNVHHMLLRSGFEELDDRLVMLRPVLGRRRGRSDPQWADVKVTHGAEAVLDRLDEIAARLVTDHADSGCRFMVVERGWGRCLVIYRRAGHRIDYASVLHVGDHELFGELSVPIRHEIMDQADVRLVGVDSRFLRGRKPPSSVEIPMNIRRLHKSTKTDLGSIDNLYSELSVLGVEALPSLRDDVRQQIMPVVRRYLPV